MSQTKTENICKGLKFEECELAILRLQVDKAEKKVGNRLVNSDEIKHILQIVEAFIKKKKLIAYGGLAIDRILPEQDKIYNKDTDLPDYDFFSPNALNDAKELGDIYVKNGYEEVEVKAGKHHGTFKVYVNFFPIADVTDLPRELFHAIKKTAMTIDGMLFVDPNFLRMSMYLELSRPDGDVSRFEKVIKRLILINKHFPLTKIKCEHRNNFQREMENDKEEEKIYNTVLDSFIEQDVVFFGGYAITLYSHYMPYHLRKKLEKFPDFDVLSTEPLKTANVVKKHLEQAHIHSAVKIIKHSNIGEIVPEHYEIQVGRDTVAFIYKPIACHSYNVLRMHGKTMKIATIDTMLSFYLAFLYTNRPYYDKERILCMSKFLFDVQQKNRLQQKGLLKRFSITCYGHQQTMEEMRAEKAEKYKELKDLKEQNKTKKKKGNKGNKRKGNEQRKEKEEFQEWFLNYRPYDNLSETERKKIQDSKKIKLTLLSTSLSDNDENRVRTRNNKKRVKNRRKTAKKKRGFFLF